ncbi:MAG TPA: PQQ-like beta-propeller repeat protein [Anaerohalosphaeraceae bacterium]|jgi:outer membrane protein assembly factor BamB|nr:PQQ-like beta-propeller repeat protein [Anaerohalosphaeraceae bacterium]HRT48929.1 PQQ-like beta-propeller repeat protein [Anaerohalosphaeraceae bacterium]HRT85052.1 PQQ-like beta-propeller repeat protein [Anaerohalosphaeraceae bacterium]
MKNVNRIAVLKIAGAMVFAAGIVNAEDWTQWRGPRRDGSVTGFVAPAAWPETLTQKWKVTVGTGCSTPAVVGNKVYVFTRQGDEEVALCLDAADGKEIWRDTYQAQAVTGAAARHPGPRSSIAVAEGRIVTLGVGGVVSCLDAATGKVVWRKDPFPKLVPRFFTSMSPMIVDGMAIAHVGTAGNGAMIAFDLATGNEKWRWSAEGPEYGSPNLLTVAGVKQLVTLTEKSIVGISVTDGKLLWSQPFVPQNRAYNATTPIVDGQTVIYMGAGRGVRAVKIEKQGDAFTVKELWNNPDIAPQYNTPVLNGGALYGMSDRGNLFCLDAKTGQARWIDQTSRDRGGFCSTIDAGSVILALPSSGELIVLKPDTDKCTEVAKIKIADTPTYAHPVIAGNCILVKDQDTLALLTLS